MIILDSLEIKDSLPSVDSIAPTDSIKNEEQPALDIRLEPEEEEPHIVRKARRMVIGEMNKE